MSKILAKLTRRFGVNTEDHMDNITNHPSELSRSYASVLYDFNAINFAIRNETTPDGIKTLQDRAIASKRVVDEMKQVLELMKKEQGK